MVQSKTLITHKLFSASASRGICDLRHGVQVLKLISNKYRRSLLGASEKFDVAVYVDGSLHIYLWLSTSYRSFCDYIFQIEYYFFCKYIIVTVMFFFFLFMSRVLE